jgi:hypothetical protein
MGGQIQGAKGSGMAVPSDKGVSGGVSADSLTMEIGSGTPLSRALPREKEERERGIEIFYHTYFLI